MKTKNSIFQFGLLMLKKKLFILRNNNIAYNCVLSEQYKNFRETAKIFETIINNKQNNK